MGETFWNEQRALGHLISKMMKLYFKLLQNEYFLPIIADIGQPWVLPVGAFSGETSGAN